jgi:hypothetical protein
LVFQTEQRKEIGQGRFETVVQRQHRAGDFLFPGLFLILGFKLKVVLEQFNDRPIRGRFAMRDGKRFEDETAALRGLFELVEEPRFPQARFAEDPHDLPLARFRLV